MDEGVPGEAGNQFRGLRACKADLRIHQGNAEPGIAVCKQVRGSEEWLGVSDGPVEVS